MGFYFIDKIFPDFFEINSTKYAEKSPKTTPAKTSDG